MYGLIAPLLLELVLKEKGRGPKAKVGAENMGMLVNFCDVCVFLSRSVKSKFILLCSSPPCLLAVFFSTAGQTVTLITSLRKRYKQHA